MRIHAVFKEEKSIIKTRRMCQCFINTMKSYVTVKCTIVKFDLKKVSEYDPEIPQSQTADNLMAPRGRAAQPSRDTRKTN